MEQLKDTRISWIAWLALTAFASLISCVVGWKAVVQNQLLVQNDSYQRLNRVLASFEQGRVLDYVPRDNAGSSIPHHWSHLLDAVIVIASLPFMAVKDLSGSLHLGAATVGPFSMVAAAVVVAAVTRRMTGSNRWAIVSGLFAIISPSVLGYGMLGQADHHVLLGAAAVGATGFAYSFSPIQIDKTDVTVSALLSVLGLWLSPEMQPFLLAAWGICLLSEIASCGKVGSYSLKFSVVLAGGVLAALIIDPPRQLLAMEPDRLSSPHAALAFSIVLATYVCRLLTSSHYGVWKNSVTAGIVAVAFVLLWAALFPTMLLGPVTAMTTGSWDDTFSNLMELQPLAQNPYLAIQLAVCPSLVLLAGSIALMIMRPGPLSVALAVLLGVVTIAAWQHLRLTVYLQLFAAVGMGALLTLAMARANTPATRLVIIASAATFAVVPMAAPILFPQSALSVVRATCDLPGVARYLKGLAGQVVMTELSYSPKLIYFSPATAVAGPYHRSSEWALKLENAWKETQFANEVPSSLKATRASAILICTHDEYPAGSLGHALASGQTPPWSRVLPMATASGFRLLQVQTADK